jgi:hypothetical protein
VESAGLRSPELDAALPSRRFRYGNRTAQNISSGCSGMGCPTNQISVSTATNRVTGSPFTYDLSGNMTNDGLNTLTYVGEGRAVTASGGLGSGTYTYDGNSLRVKKVSGSTTTLHLFSGAKVIAEYVNGAAPASARSAPTRECIYAGGALLAKIAGKFGGLPWRKFVVSNGNNENQERASPQVSGDEDSSAVLFPTPLLLLGNGGTPHPPSSSVLALAKLCKRHRQAPS